MRLLPLGFYPRPQVARDEPAFPVWQPDRWHVTTACHPGKLAAGHLEDFRCLGFGQKCLCRVHARNHAEKKRADNSDLTPRPPMSADGRKCLFNVRYFSGRRYLHLPPQGFNWIFPSSTQRPKVLRLLLISSATSALSIGSDQSLWLLVLRAISRTN